MRVHPGSMAASRREARPERAMRFDARNARVRRPGFTLIETIVAIGAVALIAVGLASIFDAVGKTVKGGKRVSLLNQYSTLIENQMRKDFSRMTRDGFLLIRHEWADGDRDGRFDPQRDAIPLHPDDVSPRARRIDQLLFFANGRFETARQPVHPDVRVTSDTAMIYYGHGQRRRVDAGLYLQPRLDDTNDNTLESRLGRLPAGEPASANPNYYPSEWTLARHATLLIKPSSSGLNRVTTRLRFEGIELTPQDDLRRLQDHEYQVGLQPAARSVFRSLNRWYPRTATGGLPALTDRFRPGPEAQRANLACGLVDIASTDLSEIRALAGGVLVGDRSDDTRDNPDRRLRPDNLARFLVNEGLEARQAPWEWEPLYETAESGPSDLDVMHLWMQDAFPTQSPAGPALGASTADDPLGVRMRVEPTPVDVLSSLASSTLESSIARLDKLMLSGSGFLPRCSEFIVEWSYGLVDPETKQTIWYGPEARDDRGRLISRAYPFNVLSAREGPDDQDHPLLVVEVPRLPFLVVDSCQQPEGTLEPRRLQNVWRHRVTPKLIYGRDRNGFPTRQQLERQLATTAHFGYADPTFKQDRLKWTGSGFEPATADPDAARLDGGDGVVNFGLQVDFPPCDGVIAENEVFPGEPAVASLPWAWPKLIRVTMTISDAQDPSIENTFQFIFGVPPDPALKIQS